MFTSLGYFIYKMFIKSTILPQMTGRAHLSTTESLNCNFYSKMYKDKFLVESKTSIYCSNKNELPSKPVTLGCFNTKSHF